MSWQSAPSNPGATAGYAYDGEGHRVAQSVTAGGSTTTTYYVAGLEEQANVSGSTSTLTKYYSVPGVVSAVNVGGTLSFLASDGLGSVSEALSATSAAATSQQLYGPYGGLRYATGNMPTAKGYTGQYADASSSGLDYYGARYYDPLVGQFASADSTADGLNRYGYVAGNPETATDPSGHRICNGGDGCNGGGDGGRLPPPPGGGGGGGSGGGSGGGNGGGSGGGGASGSTTSVPSVGTDASACAHHAHCVILGTGPDVALPKKPGGFLEDFQTWVQWINKLEQQFGGDVGIILFEALDAITGANLLHGFLSSLAGFSGTISVVAHSNAAAALFTYMAEADVGIFTGDAVIDSFVALDPPAAAASIALGTAEKVWSLWNPVYTSALASGYVLSHGTRGVEAWDLLDPLSGPVYGAWRLAPVPGVASGDWWDPTTYFQGDHLYLVTHPDPYLLTFA